MNTFKYIGNGEVRKQYNVTSDPFVERYAVSENAKWRVGVKDVFDIAGYVTGAGTHYLTSTRRPALNNARCLNNMIHSGAEIAGKTTMVELALGGHGINVWAGTPENPCDGALCPGGSSSGSAVAAASGEVEMGLGTDTGGSVRIPAACCGIFGLKTTYDVVDRAGVMPLAPSLDSIGVMTRKAAALVAWLDLVGVPGAAISGRQKKVLMVRGPASSAVVMRCVKTLERAGMAVDEMPTTVLWDNSIVWAGNTLLAAEAAVEYGWMLNESCLLSTSAVKRLKRGLSVVGTTLDVIREKTNIVKSQFAEVFKSHDLVASPTLLNRPPRLENGMVWPFNVMTIIANVAGLPAIAMPIASDPMNRWPVSLQLMAPWGADRTLAEVALEWEKRGLVGAKLCNCRPTLVEDMGEGASGEIGRVR